MHSSVSYNSSKLGEAGLVFALCRLEQEYDRGGAEHFVGRLEGLAKGFGVGDHPGEVVIKSSQTVKL